MPEVLTIQSPAKLNLALSVGPPRAEDDLHPICSWMVTVDLCDELTVTRLEDDRFSRYAILWHKDAKRRSEIDWPLTRDLAVRAHLELERLTDRRLPVQMKLQKRIPVGGGLGGGSSNAAAMLRAVNDLFELELSGQQLRELGRSLGSDVPFFIEGGSAIVEGAGEMIEHHPSIPAIHAVVVFPAFGCPTGAVYHAFDESGAKQLQPQRVRGLSTTTPIDFASLFNDLTEPAKRVAAELPSHLSELERLAERTAHLSGSGSSMFVVCDDAIHAEALANAIEQQLHLPAVAVQAK